MKKAIPGENERDFREKEEAKGELRHNYYWFRFTLSSSKARNYALIQTVEPYLKKTERLLFGLRF